MAILKPLNALDAFQLSKGLYAAALVASRILGMPEPQFDRVIEVTRDTAGLGTVFWMLLLSTYALLCALPLVWKENRLQAGVSLFSMWLWLFTGSITMLGNYSPSSGLYQVMLGAVSVWALYYRGRLHPHE